MQLTQLLLALTAAVAVTANPLEARTDAKNCNWQCEKYEPMCDQGWYPMYCWKGWGSSDCKDYCKKAHSLLPLHESVGN